MAYDGSLKFDTKIDNKGFRKGISGLESVASSSMKVVNGLMKTGAVAIAGIGIASIKVGSDFKSGMSQVAATMGITVDEINNGSQSFEMLEKAAKDMGATTMFSATESAEALNYLALAGYSAEDSVSMLPKVLNLAGAGGLDLAYASDMVTDSMGALNLEIQDADSYIDQLAKTSQKSNTDVGQLGEAILTVGANGADLKNGTVELTTAIGLLGNSGIKGAEAGTKLRNIIMAMTPTTKKAIEAFDALGVETHDAEGELRGLDEVFVDLNASMEGMTSEEKKRWLNDIFNKQDMAAVLTLMGATATSTDELGFALEELGVPLDKIDMSMDDLIATTQDFDTAQEFSAMAMKDWGLTAEQSELAYELLKGGLEDTSAWQELANEIENSEGAAQDLNDTLNDNLKGDLELFKSALSGVGIEIYESMDKPLRGVVQTFTDYVDEIGATLTKNEDLIESMEKMGLTIDESGRSINQIPVGFEGMAQVVGEILADMIVKIADFAPQAMDAAVTLATSFIGGIRESLPEISAAAVEVLTSFITGYMEIVGEIYVLGIELITNIISGMAEEMPQLLQTGIDVLMTIADAVIENLPILIDASVQIVMSVVNTIIENLPQVLETGLEILLSLINGIIDNLPKLIEALPELVNTLIDTLIDHLPQIIETGLELLMAVIDGIMDNLDLLVEASIEIVNSIVDFLIENIDPLIDVALDLTMAIIEGLIDNLPKLVSAAIELVLAIVEGLINNLPKIVNAGIKLVLGLIDGLFDMLPQLVSSGITLISELVGAILRMLPQLLSAGIQIFGELILGVLKGIPSMLKAGANLVETVGKGLKSGFVGIYNIGADMVKGLWNGINSVKDWILGKISGFTDSIMGGIKGFFGIKSPSTLMRDMIGKNLTLGIGVGMEAEMPDLQRDIDREMGNLTKTMKAAVDSESIDLSTKVTGVSDTGRRDNRPITNNNDNGVVQNVTIVSPENTPSENARQLKRAGRDLALGY